MTERKTFSKAYPLILKLEGGYKLSNYKHDRGKETWAGISRRWHPKWNGWVIIDELLAQGKSTSRLHESKKLRDETYEFYRKEFWERLELDHVQNRQISHTILSCAILSGRRVGAELVQQACQIKVDGIIGSNTLATLNSINPELFDLRLCIARIARYMKIVNRDRSQRKVLVGWIQRALDGLRDGTPEAIAELAERERELRRDLQGSGAATFLSPLDRRLSVAPRDGD